MFGGRGGRGGGRGGGRSPGGRGGTLDVENKQRKRHYVVQPWIDGDANIPWPSQADVEAVVGLGAVAVAVEAAGEAVEVVAGWVHAVVSARGGVVAVVA